MNEIEFIETSEKRPAYGVPLLIKIGDTVQNITYIMDGVEDQLDWFEPCYFDHDDDLKVSLKKVTGWAYLPESNAK